MKYEEDRAEIQAACFTLCVKHITCQQENCYITCTQADFAH
jgi:hypothetical protein